MSNNNNGDSVCLIACASLTDNVLLSEIFCKTLCDQIRACHPCGVLMVKQGRAEDY